MSVLSGSVQQVKGIGEKASEQLSQLQIETIEDLMTYFPYRYEIFAVKQVHECVHGEQVTLIATILSEPSVTFYGRRKSRLTFTAKVDDAVIRGVIFNRPYAKKQLKPGEFFTLTGTWDAHRLQITVSTYKKGKAIRESAIQPKYSLRGEITHYRLQKMIHQAIEQFGDQVEEFLPQSYLHDYKLPARIQAIQTLHKPENKETLKHARRRMIYEELLLFQLKMQLMRQQARQSLHGNAQHFDGDQLQAFVRQLPFTLTDAQKQALEDILQDMKSPYRMNRLLQGDVGSGKTVVAAIGMYAAVTAGKQAALMVPTEILAEQHYESLKTFFGDHVTIERLTGSLTEKNRKNILERLEANEIQIVVGTHALIQDDVFFNDLGLVIIDEQHRFGVNQRRKLREKGLHPDVLFMTATPIPRTLAITAFGDMDISLIRDMPKGRKPIQTYWTSEQQFKRVLDFAEKRIQAGEQVYIVCPLIEESENMDLQNAVDLYERLNQYYPETIRIGLLHGRLPTEEKDALMQQFANQSIHILVSTTVVEVGVNVPNATVMVIYHADRFGLSQLHQLRGRVGRGEKQSYCILIADPKGEAGKERMKLMTEIRDGFKLAEEDLKLRGAGDFFGQKQSGIPEFKVADLLRDYRALETARRDARHIIDHQLLKKDQNYLRLRKKLEKERFLENVLD